MNLWLNGKNKLIGPGEKIQEIIIFKVPKRGLFLSKKHEIKRK